jgi:hypothetical protein
VAFRQKLEMLVFNLRKLLANNCCDFKYDCLTTISGVLEVDKVCSHEQ